MTLYYADAKKYFLKTKKIIHEAIDDKEADQLVHVKGSVFGTIIRPGKRWSSFSEKLYHKYKANGVWLENISCAPDGSLDFINSLSGCERLVIEGGQKVDLAPLAGNLYLLDLQIYPHVKAVKFNLANLPNLSRCMVPLCPQLMSILQCQKLVCLFLCGGRHDGILKLESLSALEEFFAEGISNLKTVAFNSGVRLRSIQLRSLKSFSDFEPSLAVLEDLRVIELNKVPSMDIKWLAQAAKLECISLRLGEIESVSFLSGLKKLQVLDLFGTKVKDKNILPCDSLGGELDSRFWSEKE
jgi:hypothetical protein